MALQSIYIISRHSSFFNYSNSIEHSSTKKMSSSRDSDEYTGLVRDFSLIKTEDMAVRERRYQPMRSDKVENVEEYRKGGYHPIHIGDILTDTEGEESEIVSYKIIHKLGFGGFSTVVSAPKHLLSFSFYELSKVLK